jgi:hypothetical protein
MFINVVHKQQDRVIKVLENIMFARIQYKLDNIRENERNSYVRLYYLMLFHKFYFISFVINI